MSTTQHQPSQPETPVRRDIATATIGLLVALAFGLMVEAIKESVKGSVLSHIPPSISTFILGAIFFSVGFSFFIGTQLYLCNLADMGAGSKWWLFDFFATIFTLTIIILLGAFTDVITRAQFVETLIALYSWQMIWSLSHLALDRHASEARRNVVKRWFFANMVVLALTATVFVADSQLSHIGLLALFIIQTGHLVHDIKMMKL